MEPRPHERGKKLRIGNKVYKIKDASMEPRPHERGKQQRCETACHRNKSFNGATSSRTWKAAEA